MTQEELDALMNGGLDDIDMSEDEPAEDEVVQEESLSLEDDDDVMSESDETTATTADSKDDIPEGYSEETEHHWPLPATDENKMVHQLDDVTKESEEKASEIFDIIEEISNDLMEKEANVQKSIDVFSKNVELLSTLKEKFPEVDAFRTSLEENQDALDLANATLESLQSSGDSIMNVMDIMQYQDIHRQKIERVINVMRSLAKYMNTLFEGKVDDDKRVASAQHIAGDTHNDLASTDDIEALLAQFGS
jgi:hypothetical protein